MIRTQIRTWNERRKAFNLSAIRKKIWFLHPPKEWTKKLASLSASPTQSYNKQSGTIVVLNVPVHRNIESSF